MSEFTRASWLPSHLSLNLQGRDILSACDSGTGDGKIGDGVMLLRRDCRIAGAQTVLATHCKVSDKTTRLLRTDFLCRWRAGRSAVRPPGVPICHDSVCNPFPRGGSEPV